MSESDKKFVDWLNKLLQAPRSTCWGVPAFIELPTSQDTHAVPMLLDILDQGKGVDYSRLGKAFKLIGTVAVRQSNWP
jgi:hypothetical protein